MRYSEQQEEQYLNEHSKAVWKIVNSFQSAAKYHVSLEDLYQEGMIVLLGHLRKSRNEEELSWFPTLSIKNAICRFLLGQEAVSYPKTRTTDYARVVRKTRRVPYEMIVSSLDLPSAESEWIEHIDMKDFISRLPEKQRDWILKRVEGYPASEIAREYGVTAGAITHSVKRNMNRFLNERKTA